MSYIDIKIHLQNAAIDIYKQFNQCLILDPVDSKKTNKSGDVVKPLDEKSNNIFIEHLKKSERVFALASEELSDIILINKKAGYSMTLDPLDGSKNIDVNLSVGSIFSIYPMINGSIADFRQTGDKLLAAGYILYSQSLLFVWASDKGVEIYVYNESAERFEKIHDKFTISEEGNIYSINEAKIHIWKPNTELRDYIENLKKDKYTMRFIGCMVADVHRILMKGGIFCYPADETKPDGLLRLLYEAIPMAYVVEKAGGMSFNGSISLLKVKPYELHNRIPVFMGSPKEMKALSNFFTSLNKEQDS